MAVAEAYVQELEDKNLNSFQRLITGFGEIVRKEDFSPADLLRLEMKTTIEAIEVAAMWLADSEELAHKVALAEQAGNWARHYRLMEERLRDLGIDMAAFDVRYGGYSKLFAFRRLLQTTEERSCAGPVTLGGFNVRRLDLLATYIDLKGDSETARLFRENLLPDEQERIQVGRGTLIAAATTEESQARARRSAFRTIELLGEVYEPAQLRKFLTRSLKK